MAKIDFIGQRFGRLTVAEAVTTAGRRKRWRCICDCGGLTITETSNLTGGNTSSCGCLQREAASKSSRANLAGKSFGRLTVTSYSHSTSKGSFWLCACVCGGSKVARADTLSNGNTSSCGCLRAEKIAESNRSSIVGKRFGKLVAVEPTATSNFLSVNWLCACDCGGQKIASVSKLNRGTVLSCGCARHDSQIYSSERVRLKAAEYGHRRRARKLGVGGDFTAGEIRRLFSLQRGRCAWCPSRLKPGYHKDHRKALANGGDNSIRNIELLCPPCNLKKGAMDEILWANCNGRLL